MEMCFSHSARKATEFAALNYCSQRRQATFTLQGNQFFLAGGGGDGFRLSSSIIMNHGILRNRWTIFEDS